MKTTDIVIKSYLIFIINHKRITGRSYRNRPASDFYRHLKNNSELYGITIMDQLKKDAYYVMKGIIL